MTHRVPTMQRTAARLALSAALTVSASPVSALAAPSGPSEARDCIARDRVLEKRWSDVERRIRQNLDQPACDAQDAEMRYGLAYAIEQQAKQDTRRACEASRLYAALAEHMAPGDFRDAVRARAAATATACACRPPSDARLAGRWIEAEAIAIRRLEDDACASVRGALHLELGRLVERDADRLPERACEAASHYRSAAEDPDPERALAGRIGARRMDALCDAAPTTGLPTAEHCAATRCAAPACASHPRCADPHTGGAALGLAIGAGASAVAAGVLFGLAFDADADRLDALDDYRMGHRAGDAAAVADAAARHRDAADRETAFGLSAWALVAAGAGLGLAAALVWPSASDSGDVALAPGPAGLSVRGRF